MRDRNRLRARRAQLYTVDSTDTHTHIDCNNNIAQNGVYSVYTQAQFIISRKMFALVCNFEMIIGLVLGIVELHYRLYVRWYSHSYVCQAGKESVASVLMMANASHTYSYIHNQARIVS